MSAYYQHFFRKFYKHLSPTTVAASAILGGILLVSSRNSSDPYMNFMRQHLLQQNNYPAECYASDQRRKRLSQMNTNVYVWGEGQQVDIAQDYSNYSPKNLKPFKGKTNPNVVDVAFGWYHEAYIDQIGRLWVCKKPKLTSVKVEEIDEKNREDLIDLSEKIPGKPKVKQAAFTRQRLFVLTEKGQVYVFKIQETMPSIDLFDHFKKGLVQIQADLQVDQPIHVKDLSNVKSISCGSDHFIALTQEGKVFAMGDDTFGQCGQSSEGRSTTAPFFEKRYGKPVQVQIPEKVLKVVSGYRHNLAITEKGNIFGWGYNNQQQLAHSDEYAQEENPWHAIFTPMPIKRDLEGKFVVDAACGEEFSLILCKNPSNNNVQEVWATGNNLRGQLGINRMSHVQDLTIIEDISGFVDLYENKPLNINNLTCGRRHCIATFDYGAFFIWGDNEFGQLGDKKRRFLESPFPKSKFERRHNVENVICGIDNCAVIVEDLSEKVPPKKKKPSKKRTIKKSQMVTNPEDLKMLSESKIVSKDPNEKTERKPLSERMREKLHNTVYSDKDTGIKQSNNNQKQQEVDTQDKKE